MTVSKSNLYNPIQFGPLELNHRVVLSPMSRGRADDNHVPTALMADYYEERAKTEGSLLISEGILPSPLCGLIPKISGIWNEQQTEGWKKIFDAVHKHGSKIFGQLGGVGANGIATYMQSKGYEYLDVNDGDFTHPMLGTTARARAYTIDEIKQIVQDHRNGAKNLISAGADGVEIHACNDMLIHRFMMASTNKRTDEYGSQNLENRTRLLFEVIDAVVAEIGVGKVALRLSPWTTESKESPLPLFTYILDKLQQRADNGSQLVYIHFIEPRVLHSNDRETANNNEWIRLIWKGPMIRNGGYDKTSAENQVDGDGNLLIAFGRHYTSNPDLPLKLKHDAPLTKYDRSTFYSGEENGYTTFKRQF